VPQLQSRNGEGRQGPQLSPVLQMPAVRQAVH
jgi:hypothetical protein